MNNKPFEILLPEKRWAPGQAQLNDNNNRYEMFLAPLVHKVRKAVEEWRNRNYEGATETTKALLNHWFNREHTNENGQKFSFYFSQRESVESVIYLYEIAKAKDKYELIKFDDSGRVSTGMFDESWTRYVIKMATGTGKTKVLGLVLVWSYFNAKYEAETGLSKNFLVIAPNIIVLNRIRKDFDGLKFFFEDPFIPENGWADKDWRNDFQLTLHIQDELKPITDSGNIFLTNIHRVFLNEEKEQSMEELFLGTKPKADADTSKGLDLGKVLRSDKIKDLVILNDEAHHIHDQTLAWFQSISDISNKLKLKTGKHIGLQCDVTATPKHNNGAIFVQTICDYPLAEAIQQNVVKSPVLPDEASRLKLEEKPSDDVVERYNDFIHLGYIEWEKQYEEMKSQKTPLLFIMAMTTKESDAIAEYLELTYPLLKNAVLSIHTKRNGEISEDSKNKQNNDKLDALRKAADDVDKDNSPYKAICSVLMLREGWDVKNVTTIVGLRPFNADSRILPEQAIGRGLRKMFPLDVHETLSVIGTAPFIEFVESLKTEGVEFQYSPMGKDKRGKGPIIIEVDKENPNKNLDDLDILLPQLTARFYREYKNLDKIKISKLIFEKAHFKSFNEAELREINFVDFNDVFSHTTTVTDSYPNYRNVVSFITQNILKENRLISGFKILYPKVETFIKEYLFGKEVELESVQTIRNLLEVQPKAIMYNTFKNAINELTVTDGGTTEIKNYFSLKTVRPKVTDEQPFLIPKKSIFNKVIGDNGFELEFASFCESKFDDVVAFAKNTMGDGGVNFKIEYQAEDGNIREYFPDFFVKTSDISIYIVETKGREDLDDLRKVKRLAQWCKDVNALQSEKQYTSIYIKQEEWDKYKANLRTFNDVIAIFQKDNKEL